MPLEGVRMEEERRRRMERAHPINLLPACLPSFTPTGTERAVDEMQM